MTYQFNDDQHRPIPFPPGPPIWPAGPDYHIPIVSPVGRGPKGDTFTYEDLSQTQITEIGEMAIAAGAKGDKGDPGPSNMWLGAKWILLKLRLGTNEVTIPAGDTAAVVCTKTTSSSDQNIYEILYNAGLAFPVYLPGNTISHHYPLYAIPIYHTSVYKNIIVRNIVIRSTDETDDLEVPTTEVNIYVTNLGSSSETLSSMDFYIAVGDEIYMSNVEPLSL